MERILRALVNPLSGAVIFALALIVFYGLGAWIVDSPMVEQTSADMALLPWISAVCVIIGSMFFQRHRPVEFDVQRGKWLVWGVTLLFLVFCAVTILSAESIPLVEAIHGASPAEIAVARENFLKARTGWASILVYVNAMLTAVILPYCMCVALLHKYKYRWLIVSLFFLYSLVFVEKAFFLRIFLPLMAVVVVTRARHVRLWWLLAGAVALLAANVLISGFVEASGTTVSEFLIFRIFAVPLSTVIDSLNHWWETYHGGLFLGSTNLVLATLFDLPRVQFEREVFEYQWGASATGTGSANAAYFVEAYINFGIVGVIVFSLLIGALLSYMGRSRDMALRCTLPLVMYTLFLGGMLGLLFGNGLLLLLLISAYLTRRPAPESELVGHRIAD